MRKKTQLTKLGRDPKKNKGYVNPGIYKGSTIIFNDFKSYIKDINRKTDASALYGINNNPLVDKLEEAISSLYNAEDTVIAPSGLAAIIVPFFAFLKNNDEVLINDSVYNPTRSYCEKILKNFGVKVKYFHPIKNKLSYVVFALSLGVFCRLTLATLEAAVTPGAVPLFVSKIFCIRKTT